jgi:ribosomal protein S1
MARYPAGTSVSGSVADCQVYGIWVTLDDFPDVPALLEIIHFSIIQTDPDHRIEFPDDYPDIGARVDAQILAWSQKPKDVRLTQLSHLDWSHTRHLRETDG